MNTQLPTFGEFVNEDLNELKNRSKQQITKLKQKIENHKAFKKYYQLTGEDYYSAMEIWIEEYNDLPWVGVFSPEEAKELVGKLTESTILNKFNDFVLENFEDLKEKRDKEDDGMTKLKKSKYKGVYNVISGGKVKWMARKSYKGKKFTKYCDNERDAALAYDKFLLGKGLDPVNILKPKK